MKDQCNGCKFWEYIDAAQEDESAYEDAGLGTCRRFPPVWIGNHQLENNMVQELRAYTPVKWEQPITTTYDWCGEFRIA